MDRLVFYSTCELRIMDSAVILTGSQNTAIRLHSDSTPTPLRFQECLFLHVLIHEATYVEPNFFRLSTGAVNSSLPESLS